MTATRETFVPARCPWRDRLLKSVETAGAITFGHDGVEYYGLRDGRLFRVAQPGEPPHAAYPKSTDAWPDGVPLRRVVITDAPEEPDGC